MNFCSQRFRMTAYLLHNEPTSYFYVARLSREVEP